MPTRTEIERYLAGNDFTGYQSVRLPHGLSIPGQNMDKRIDTLVKGRVEGKSVLDIGTYYGLFPAECMRHGAVRAVGIEPDEERYRIAYEASRLNGGSYEIIKGHSDTLSLDEQFDIVLFLNTLHHVNNPIDSVRRILRFCRDTLIIEFCLLYDPQYLQQYYPSALRSFLIKSKLGRLHSMFLGALTQGLPLLAVGNGAYHRTFYFSREGFYNVFVVHNGFFSSVEFLASDYSRDRAIAICKVNAQAMDR